MTVKRLTVVTPGPLSTVQDLGRPGYAHMGVPLSGAADRAALRLANRLVGNTENAAAIETTMGGLEIRAHGLLLISVTGARGDVLLDDTPVAHASTVVMQDGQHLRLAGPTDGLRGYVAVRGGIDVEPILGSRATDTLSGIGPDVLTEGTELPIGVHEKSWPAEVFSPFTGQSDSPALLYATLGPRDDHARNAELLFRGEWVTDARSNRIGVRLNRADETEALQHIPGQPDMPSEGVALGSIQLPPAGQPVIFLADHPVTGGYPVIAVLRASSVDRAAQLTPGHRVRFMRSNS